VGILHAGALIALGPAAELKARYEAASLEEAFFAATGASFEETGEEAKR